MKKASSIIPGLLIMVFLTSCANQFANQSPPSIKHGEFPFYLKYEMHGKIYEIKDTVICNFAGYDLSIGKFRSWDEHLKSGRKTRDRARFLESFICVPAGTCDSRGERIQTLGGPDDAH